MCGQRVLAAHRRVLVRRDGKRLSDAPTPPSAALGLLGFRDPARAPRPRLRLRRRRRRAGVRRATLERIRALAIPPAWQEVWICVDPRGHLQATGIDAAGRKQYLYHEAWRAQRDRQKFRRMVEFAEALPRLRRRLTEGLAGDELDEVRVLACAVRLLDVGLFRIGGEEYAEQGGGLGLATLHKDHVSLRDDAIVFDYPAKSGVRRVHEVRDPEALAVIRALKRRRGGGPQLLAYRDGRRWTAVHSEDINDYIKRNLGEGFSAKDFRTWNATVMAAVSVSVAAGAIGPHQDGSQARGRRGGAAGGRAAGQHARGGSARLHRPARVRSLPVGVDDQPAACRRGALTDADGRPRRGSSGRCWSCWRSDRPARRDCPIRQRVAALEADIATSAPTRRCRGGRDGQAERSRICSMSSGRADCARRLPAPEQIGRHRCQEGRAHTGEVEVSADYRFDPGEAVAGEIRRCAATQLDRAVTELTGGVEADPEKAVHAARKAVKKERSLLRLARGSIADRGRRRENARCGTRRERCRRRVTRRRCWRRSMTSRSVTPGSCPSGRSTPSERR